MLYAHVVPRGDRAGPARAHSLTRARAGHRGDTGLSGRSDPLSRFFVKGSAPIPRVSSGSKIPAMQHLDANLLREVFASLPQQTKDALASETSPRLLSFAALHFAALVPCERLSADQVVACLEAAGVSLPWPDARDALDQAVTDRTVSKQAGEPGKGTYKLMTTGRQEIKHLLNEGEQPRTVGDIRDPVTNLPDSAPGGSFGIGVGRIGSHNFAPKGPGMSTKPRVFIGSSTEGRDIAAALQLNLNRDTYCTVWDQAFPLSQNTIDTLLERFTENDFSIFVFSPDDLTTIRKEQYEAARDNVLFEAGLFMGMHGKERTYIVAPDGIPNFRIPSDLWGHTVAPYSAEFATKNPNAALGAAATMVRQAIRKHTSQQPALQIRTGATWNEDAFFKLKLTLTVTNDSPIPVTIESKRVLLHDGISLHPNAERMKDGLHRPEFLLGKRSNGKDDAYEPMCVLERNGSAKLWVPIDPATTLPALLALVRARKSGIWQYRCTWLDTPPRTIDYEEAV